MNMKPIIGIAVGFPCGFVSAAALRPALPIGKAAIAWLHRQMPMFGGQLRDSAKITDIFEKLENEDPSDLFARLEPEEFPAGSGRRCRSSTGRPVCP